MWSGVPHHSQFASQPDLRYPVQTLQLGYGGRGAGE
jgi:hypothetical protein